jgi:hypothetical protein
MLTLNMQAPKASDSPQHIKRGTAADLRIRLRQDWPRVGTASPPKRENILTPQKETYKGGKPAFWLSMLSILCHFHGLLFARQCWTNRYATQHNASHPPQDAYRDRLSTNESAILQYFGLSIWIKF